MLLKPQQVNFGQAINCDEKIVGIRTTSSTINGARNKAIGLILQDSIFLLWAKCNRIYNPNGEMNRKEDRIGNSLRAPTPAPRVDRHSFTGLFEFLHVLLGMPRMRGPDCYLPGLFLR